MANERNSKFLVGLLLCDCFKTEILWGSNMYFRIDALIKVSETVSCGKKYNLLSADLPSHLF